MSWKTIIPVAICGITVQGLAILLFRQQWFMRFVFPNVDGWGYWGAGISLAYAFLFVVVPLVAFTVFGYAYRKSNSMKWKNAIAATLLNLLPIILIVVLTY